MVGSIQKSGWELLSLGATFDPLLGAFRSWAVFTILSGYSLLDIGKFLAKIVSVHSLLCIEKFSFPTYAWVSLIASHMYLYTVIYKLNF